MWLVSAVFAGGKVLRLGGLEVTEDLVCVETSLEMLQKLLAFLILQSPHDSVVVCTLNQHSLVWNACQLVIDLRIEQRSTL